MDFDLNKRYCYYFNEISMIPRGSKNEKAVSDYVCRFAQAHGLSWKQDHVYNVMIDKPASPGYEDHPPVILQAHMDMVCEKNENTVHDFEKDPLTLYVKDGWLYARGTTLGADDGSGVAYMLAVLEDETLKHPPLECIFTVQEEIGLLGAAELKAEDLHGHRYISLDGSGLSVTETSCAGATSVRLEEPILSEPCSKNEYALTIRGLLGGHSGGLIHLERGNANVLAGRILNEAMLAGIDIVLTSLKGGNKENAIPRESRFSFVSDASFEDIQRVIQASAEAVSQELAFSDSGITITVSPCGKAESCFQKSLSDRLLQYIYLMPHGFQHRSMAVENLTTASLNLGVISMQEDKIIFEIMVRAAEDSFRHDICNKLSLLAGILGLNLIVPEGYPGWAYSETSELRTIMRTVVEKHGLNYQEAATHGGLECGIIKGLDPQMDIITFGPVTEAIHSPDERMLVGTFDLGYRILCEMLEAC